MGQATVDLPDSLEPPPVSAANTDDLLAQLAGEEIDRLLAEEDAVAAAPLGPKSTADPAAGPPLNLDVAVQGSPQLQAAAAAAATAAAVDKSVSAQLDDLFGKMDAADGAKPRTDESLAPMATPAVTPAAPSSVADPAEGPSVAAELAAEMDQDAAMMRGGVADNSPAGRVDPTVAPISPSHSPVGASVLVFMRPLEWISAPLDSFPDQVRDTVGKIAILTTVNAISILVYLLFVRGH